MSRKAALQHNFSTRTSYTHSQRYHLGKQYSSLNFATFSESLKPRVSYTDTMEIPRLELEDPKLAKRVVDLVAPLVITAQKQEKMIEVLERELDMGLQHGLSGQASLERQIKECVSHLTTIF